MASNQTTSSSRVFVRWGDDRKDIIKFDSLPVYIADLRNAFKAQHLGASTISSADIQVFARIDGTEPIDAFDELGDLGKSKENPLFLILPADGAPVPPPSTPTSSLRLAVPPPSTLRSSLNMDGAPVPSLYTPRSRDISNQVAAVFEHEANRYLDDYLQQVLLECEFTEFKKREIEDCPFALEIDSFSYMTKDTLMPPNETPGLGIYVVRSSDILLKNPVAAPRQQFSHSPGAIAENQVSYADKYFIGESYSGSKKKRMEEKVVELEKKLQKMKIRHAELSGSALDDVTSLFGGAVLTYTCRSSRRKEQSQTCMKAVLRNLSSQTTPILWRLVQAERLFVAVLSTTDAANTYAFRECASSVQNIEISVEAMDGKVEAINGKLQVIIENLNAMQGIPLPAKENAAEDDFLHNYE